jgi:hypothetical protein
MNRSRRTFVLVALAGLGLLVLAHAPAQAQFRRPVPAPIPPVRPVPAPIPPVRPVPAPIPPVRPVVPRAFVTTPPPIVPYANSFTYLPSGLNLNQAAALNALRVQTRLYNSLYYPYYLPGYSSLNIPYYGPGIFYNPFSLYNPYFPLYGLYR